MGTRNKVVITNQGRALLAKLVKGTSLTITRAVIGNQSVDPDTLETQTAVASEKQTATFRTVAYPIEGRCSIPCRITNSGLTAAYSAMQVGVYANDPDEGEILFILMQDSTASGVYIPSETESPGFIAEWVVTFDYGQADDVVLTVDPADTVTIEMMEQELERKAETDLTNVDDGAFKERAETSGAVHPPVTTGGSGAAYTAEVPGITELYAGLTLTIIPHATSTTTAPTLNVNGLGDVNMRQRLASTTGATTTGAINTWLSKGNPVSVTYNGTLWMVNHPRTSASYIYGTVDIKNGGTGAEDAETARANLGAAPAFTYGTEDITAGSASSEPEGTLHFVIE